MSMIQYNAKQYYCLTNSKRTSVHCISLLKQHFGNDVHQLFLLPNAEPDAAAAVLGTCIKHMMVEKRFD